MSPMAERLIPKSGVLNWKSCTCFGRKMSSVSTPIFACPSLFNARQKFCNKNGQRIWRCQICNSFTAATKGDLFLVSSYYVSLIREQLTHVHSPTKPGQGHSIHESVVTVPSSARTSLTDRLRLTCKA
jgi:hypothetical protein